MPAQQSSVASNTRPVFHTLQVPAAGVVRPGCGCLPSKVTLLLMPGLFSVPCRCQLLEWCDPAVDAYPSTVLAGTCLLSYDPVEGRDSYIMMQASPLVTLNLPAQSVGCFSCILAHKLLSYAGRGATLTHDAGDFVASRLVAGSAAQLLCRLLLTPSPACPSAAPLPGSPSAAGLSCHLELRLPQYLRQQWQHACTATLCRALSPGGQPVTSRLAG